MMSQQTQPAVSAAGVNLHTADWRPSRMLRSSDRNKQWGRAGERFVAENIPCPNCGGKLVSLPADTPVVDLICRDCTFPVQVKSSHHRPKRRIPGSNYPATEKWLRKGRVKDDKDNPVLPLITYHELETGKLVQLYLVPKDHVHKRKRRANSKAKRQMCDFVRMDQLAPKVLLSPRADVTTPCMEPGSTQGSRPRSYSQRVLVPLS